MTTDMATAQQLDSIKTGCGTHPHHRNPFCPTCRAHATLCTNCGSAIHPHKPGHDGYDPCWVHDDTDLHECGVEYGEDMAEPVSSA